MWIVLWMVACYIWCFSRPNTGTYYIPYFCEWHTVPNIVTSTAKLFADNTKSYQSTDKWCGRLHYPTIRSNHPRSLGGLLAVKFNPTKCEVKKISHNKDKSPTWYQVLGTELRNVSNYKDLRVTMASYLKWSKHVEEIVQSRRI